MAKTTKLSPKEEKKKERKKSSEKTATKKKTTKKLLITRDMNIGEVLQIAPEAAEIMMMYGLHCIGCHVSFYESIEMGAKAHGLTEDLIDNMVEDMNKTVNNKKKSKK